MDENDTELSPGQEPNERVAPWSPTGIALISVLCSPLPGGILHALNYERLGKPGRKRLTFAMNLIASMILLLAAFFGPGQMQMLTVVASLFMAAYFYKSQEELFRRYQSAGGKKASLLFPALLSVIGLLILGGGLTFAESFHHQARLDAAVRLMDEGKYAEAEEVLKEYQSSYPDDTSGYWNLAVVYENLGNVDKAKGELKALLIRDPGSKRAREYLARLESAASVRKKPGARGPRQKGKESSSISINRDR